MNNNHTVQNQNSYQPFNIVSNNQTNFQNNNISNTETSTFKPTPFSNTNTNSYSNYSLNNNNGFRNQNYIPGIEVRGSHDVKTFVRKSFEEKTPGGITCNCYIFSITGTEQFESLCQEELRKIDLKIRKSGSNTPQFNQAASFSSNTNSNSNDLQNYLKPSTPFQSTMNNKPTHAFPSPGIKTGISSTFNNPWSLSSNKPFTNNTGTFQTNTPSFGQIQNKSLLNFNGSSVGASNTSTAQDHNPFNIANSNAFNNPLKNSSVSGINQPFKPSTSFGLSSQSTPFSTNNNTFQANTFSNPLQNNLITNSFGIKQATNQPTTSTNFIHSNYFSNTNTINTSFCNLPQSQLNNNIGPNASNSFNNIQPIGMVQPNKFEFSNSNRNITFNPFTSDLNHIAKSNSSPNNDLITRVANEDYLGIRALCKEAKTNLSRGNLFRDLEEVFKPKEPFKDLSNRSKFLDTQMYHTASSTVNMNTGDRLRNDYINSDLTGNKVNIEESYNKRFELFSNNKKEELAKEISIQPFLPTGHKQSIATSMINTGQSYPTNYSNIKSNNYLSGRRHKPSNPTTRTYTDNKIVYKSVATVNRAVERSQNYYDNIQRLTEEAHKKMCGPLEGTIKRRYNYKQTTNRRPIKSPETIVEEREEYCNSNDTTPYLKTLSDREEEQGLLSIRFKLSRPVVFESIVKINKKNRGIVLKETIKDILKEYFPNDFMSLGKDDIIIISNQGILKDGDVLEDKDMISSQYVLTVCIDEKAVKNQDEDNKMEVSSIREGSISHTEEISGNLCCKFRFSK